MKLKATLFLLLLAALTLSFAQLGAPLPNSASASETLAGNSSQGASSLAERIQRVENGLLGSVVIKGQANGMNIAERMKYYSAPGVSVAVINNGRIEWAKGYGVVEAGGTQPITTDTLFQAGSISKPVAAMAALRLVEQGKLDLDEDVNGKLKSWKVPENDFTKEKKVTLRRLLSHSAGLTVHGFPGYKADVEVPTVVQVLNGEKPANTPAIRVDLVPGTQWRYSGGGYTIMQQLLIDVTGKPFPQLTHELVLNPAGLKHSTYEQPLPKALAASAATAHRNGAPVKGRYHTYPEMAAAGLWTTPSDLALLAIEIQQEIAGRSSKVLSTKMANQMVAEQIQNYGLGPSVQGQGQSLRFSHGGVDEGFEAFWIAFAHTGQGAVVMVNANRGSGLAQEIVRSIAQEYGWSDRPPSKERTLTKVDPKIYAAYVGEYDVSGRTVTISSEAGRLFILAPPLGPSRVELYPESETRFFILEQDLTVTFAKDEQGVFKEIVLQPGTQTLRGTKVK